MKIDTVYLSKAEIFLCKKKKKYSKEVYLSHDCTPVMMILLTITNTTTSTSTTANNNK